eukprot:747219-Hanusia_phi.AAC.6
MKTTTEKAPLLGQQGGGKKFNGIKPSQMLRRLIARLPTSVLCLALGVCGLGITWQTAADYLIAAQFVKDAADHKIDFMPKSGARGSAKCTRERRASMPGHGNDDDCMVAAHTRLPLVRKSDLQRCCSSPLCVPSCLLSPCQVSGHFICVFVVFLYDRPAHFVDR